MTLTAFGDEPEPEDEEDPYWVPSEDREEEDGGPLSDATEGGDDMSEEE